MSNLDSGPYEEGKIAASEGEPLKANPYERDTEEYDLWREGYRSHDETDDAESED